MNVTLRQARRAFRPTAKTPCGQWIRDKIYTHEGKPYDDGAYPHITAPGGPADAVDDPGVRTIWLQWGSRLGKSFFAQSLALYVAAIRPAPAMICGPDGKLTKEVVQRIYGQMSHMRCMRRHLKPLHKRNRTQIVFESSRQFVAWARSSATLADKAVWYGHANEVDKWEHESTSTEADPLELLFERGKEFRSRKFVVESTPSIKGRSRVEAGRLASTNCTLHVPCPHCDEYQPLAMKNLKWETLESGKSDKDLARQTAYYKCEHCSKQILDEHRIWMMRRGAWCPEGCSVKKKEAKKLFDSGGSKPWAGWSLANWIEGEPLRDGPDAGYQLSSLYALTLSWGDIAAQFVGCKGKPQKLRNFVNSWLAETWADAKRQATWEDVGKKIIHLELKHKQVPSWASLITIGADRQGENRLPYIVDAWGPERRNATIDYGEVLSFEDLEKIVRTQWIHADGKGSLRMGFGLFDTGYRPDKIYAWCLAQHRAGYKILPSKGSPGSLGVEWRQSKCGDNTSAPGMILFHMDTITSQLWLDGALHDIPAGDPGSIALYSGSLADHEDFLQQIINDAPVQRVDGANIVRESWERINDTIPNDYRDCKRNAYTAMLIYTRGGAIAPRSGMAPQPAVGTSRASAPQRTVREPEQPGRAGRMQLRRR